MDDVIIIRDEDSENSVVEVEVPRKPTPPLIQIEDEEITLNVTQRSSGSILAKNFIDRDEMLVMVEKEVNSQVINSPLHWTPDMIKFYNDDWGDEEQFVVEKLQEKMDKSPSLWEVSRKDMLQLQNKSRCRTRCWNCLQHGHHFSLCPEPPHVPKCHMCGNEGHSEPSCPDSKCLNCGNNSDSYVYCCFKCKNEVKQVCSRCHLIGHNFINCTDHWRLFHSTTGTTSVKEPNKQPYKSDKDLWCCNCGKKGHHQAHCVQRKNCGGFADTLPFVVSYKRSFNYKHLYNNSIDTPLKKSKNRRKEKNKNDRILRLNPMHKTIKKDKTILKHKFLIKKKRRRKQKRDSVDV